MKSIRCNPYSEDEIKEWEHLFEQALRRLFPSPYVYGLYTGVDLVFSEEEPIDRFGVSLEEAIDRILSDYGKCLKPKEKRRIAAAKTEGELSGAIECACESLREGTGNPEIYREIFDWLNMNLGRGETMTLGRYIHDYDEKRIVLYSKNIQKEADTEGVPVLDVYRHVFAHEMFHAFHYESGQYRQEILLRADYTSKIVKESLASCFEWIYCKTHAIQNNLPEDWKRYSVLNYPYSGAKQFRDRKTFCGVFDTSLKDMDAALRMMFDAEEDTFYRIKNMVSVRYREKANQKPRKTKPRVVTKTRTIVVRINNEDAELQMVSLYLRDYYSLNRFEKEVIKPTKSQHGNKARRLLRKYHVDTSRPPKGKSGILKTKTLDQEIADSWTNPFYQETLIKIRDRGF